MPWERRYATAARTGDVTTITLCVTVGVAVGAGLPNDMAFPARLASGVLAWTLLIGCFALGRAWESRVLGTGSTARRRLSKGMWRMLQHHEPDDYVLATGTACIVENVAEYCFTRVGLVKALETS